MPWHLVNNVGNDKLVRKRHVIYDTSVKWLYISI